MLGIRDVGRALVWMTFSALWLLATPDLVNGGFTGDAELIATVSKKYRENLDRIQFLTGRVRERSLTLDPANADKSYSSEYTIDYACDATNSKYWYRATTDKNNFADGRPIPNVGLNVYSAVRLGDDWFEHSYEPGADNKRSALQFAPPARLGCWTHHRFDPKLTYTDSGEYRDIQLQYLRDHFNDAAYSGSVIQIGDDIIVEQVDQSGTFRTKTVYSLRYGGNATRLNTSVRSADANEEDSIEWEWQLINGVSVPKRAHMSISMSGKDAPARNEETTLEWLEQRVNEPPAAETFSLANIGLREGDLIREKDQPVRILKSADLLPPKDDAAESTEAKPSQPAASTPKATSAAPSAAKEVGR